MHPTIAFDNWQPLSVSEVIALFKDAPFKWCLAGGYAIEQFVGRSFREHGDIDVMIFRDDQLFVQQWLGNWKLFAADPPGTLRQWRQGEYLERGIHDIWGYQSGADTWQMQLMLMEVDGDRWFNRRNPAIGGLRDELFVKYGSIPCVRVEVQLLYKAKNPRPKDEKDFWECLDVMDAETCHWLRDNLRIQHPGGHDWLKML